MGLTNEHVELKILAKIKIYILTSAELLSLFAIRYPVKKSCYPPLRAAPEKLSILFNKLPKQRGWFATA